MRQVGAPGKAKQSRLFKRFNAMLYYGLLILEWFRRPRLPSRAALIPQRAATPRCSAPRVAIR